jgi:hypothetical protein
MRTTLTPKKKFTLPRGRLALVPGREPRPGRLFPMPALGVSVILLLGLAACGSGGAGTNPVDSGARDADAKETKDTSPPIDTGTGPKMDGGSDVCTVCVVGTAVIGQCCLE